MKHLTTQLTSTSSSTSLASFPYPKLISRRFYCTFHTLGNEIICENTLLLRFFSLYSQAWYSQLLLAIWKPRLVFFVRFAKIFLLFKLLFFCLFAFFYSSLVLTNQPMPLVFCLTLMNFNERSTMSKKD